MNIKEYISSGVLESYALGELTPSERADIERNLAQYPELRQELALIEQTMEEFFMKAGKAPGPGVKERILEAAAPKVIKLNYWKYATAASVALALTSALLAYNFWSNWKETEVSLQEMRAMSEHLAGQYNHVNQRLDAIESEMKIMTNPSFQRVIMKGTQNAPEALASIYWNQTSQEVYLSIQNLKVLSQDQQYQLWAIVDGKPVDMGVLDSVSGLIKMKATGKAAAFAITVEPRGGKPSPTLETMQVLGNT